MIFSDAEINEFESVVQQQFNIPKRDYPIKKFYALCDVHVDISECRIRRKHAIVPR